MMQANKWIVVLVIALLFCTELKADTEIVGFTKIYEMIESTNNEVYLITDNGTWQLNKNRLIKVDSSEPIQVDTKPYQVLISNVYNGSKDVWQKMVGVSYILLTVIFVLIYIYYHSATNKRRRSYYERMKVQQQVLSIAFLATGDEVLDCDIVNDTIYRINKNATLGLPDEIYFQSEAFISSLHPDDKSIFLAHFKSLVHSGNNNYEIEYRVADGTDGWMWLVERGCVIERDEKGRAKRLVSSMRDISSIKKEHENLIRLISELERRLKASEAALVNS